VLVVNLGGVHRLLARLFGNFVGGAQRYQILSERSLPGGEMLVDDKCAA